MRLGQKAATTRLLDGPDDLTGVSHPGDLCVGEVGTRGFGILVIRRVLDMYFSDVDGTLAKIENMKVSALQAFTRNFSCFPSTLISREKWSEPGEQFQCHPAPRSVYD